MIKAVIFDCFGVLYTDGKSRIIDQCPDENKQELGDLFMQTDYGYITAGEFNDAAAKLLGISTQDLEAIQHNLYFRNDELVAYIKKLQALDYKIGLLSNVSEEFFTELFTQADQDELFDTVVLSSKEGVIKPSSEIYHLTLDRLTVEPAEAIMIDDVERNIQGALNVGMKGVVYRSTSQAIKDIETILSREGVNA